MISFVRTYLSWPISAAPATRRLARAEDFVETDQCDSTSPARWVERLVRRSSMSDLSAVARRAKAEGGSDTHQLHLMVMMGFAGLNLSTRSTRSPDAAQRHQRVYARLRRAMTCGVVRC